MISMKPQRRRLPNRLSEYASPNRSLTSATRFRGRFEEPSAGSRSEEAPRRLGGAASHLGGLALCGSSPASQDDRTWARSASTGADRHEARILREIARRTYWIVRHVTCPA